MSGPYLCTKKLGHDGEHTAWGDLKDDANGEDMCMEDASDGDPPGKSKKTQSDAARKAAGRVMVRAWLELDVYERLATRAHQLGISKTEYIAKLVAADIEPTQ